LTRSLGAALRKTFALHFALLVLLAPAAALFCESAPTLQLWYWHHSYLTSDAAVQSSKLLLDRAAEAGYNGVAFWDNSFAAMSDAFWPAANVERMRTVMQYATAKGLRVMGLAAPYGWSNGALAANGNWAEAQRVIGATFKVNTSATRLDFVNQFPPLTNEGFEEGRSGWFSTGDAGIGLSDVSHGGKHSGVIVDATGNARFRQRIVLTPWRQYHLRVWFKSASFTGASAIEVQDWWHRRVLRFRAELDARGTQGWTRVDYTFNSQSTTSAYLYFGVWGSSRGMLWFDDVLLEEAALVYVARRPGAPLHVYSAEDRRWEFSEGQDYSLIFDPALSPPRAAFRDSYHAPPPVLLPPKTRLRPSQFVAVDYYAVFPLPLDQQVSLCLTDAAALHWVEDNARAVIASMPRGSGVLLSYDEIRQMNSCAGCRETKLSAGDLLASNVRRVTGTVRAIASAAPLFIWGDMFDPYQNARSNYYDVEGDLGGSWKGLPPELTVLNWDRAHLKQSLTWFSGSDKRQPIAHKQLIASYYDGGNADVIDGELRTARGIPGIAGAMYVTWQDDYSQLERFAAAARRGWDSYGKDANPR
jgi:hypothetical protein